MMSGINHYSGQLPQQEVTRMTSEIIETKTTKVWLEEGIVYFKIQPGAEVTLEDTKDYVKVKGKLTAGQKSPLLADIRGTRSITREARAYLAGEEAAALTSAAALIIGSPVSKVIGNFFLGLNKPVYPTRLFTSEEKAVEWLKEFLEK